MAEKRYRSMDEFEREFFPRHHREKELAALTPREHGKRIASEVLQQLREVLHGGK